MIPYQLHKNVDEMVNSADENELIIHYPHSPEFHKAYGLFMVFICIPLWSYELIFSGIGFIYLSRCDVINKRSKYILFMIYCLVDLHVNFN